MPSYGSTSTAAAAAGIAHGEKGGKKRGALKKPKIKGTGAGASVKGERPAPRCL